MSLNKTENRKRVMNIINCYYLAREAHKTFESKCAKNFMHLMDFFMVRNIKDCDSFCKNGYKKKGGKGWCIILTYSCKNFWCFVGRFSGKSLFTIDRSILLIFKSFGSLPEKKFLKRFWTSESLVNIIRSRLQNHLRIK